MGVASVLVFALLIGFLVTLTVVIVLVLAVRRRRAVPHPACGQCRYAVAGLGTMTCPECGADLREVGILTPGTLGASWLVPLLVAVLWTLLVLIIGSVAFTMIQRVLPRTYQTTSTWTLLGSPGFDPVTLAFEGTGPGPNAPYDTVTLTTPPRPGVADDPLVVKLPDLAIDGAADLSLSPETVAAWLRRDREVRDPADLTRAGEELVKHVTAGATGRGLTVTGPALYMGGSIKSRSMRLPRPGWYTTLLLGTWAGVWGIGLGAIVWSARRRRRAAAA